MTKDELIRCALDALEAIAWSNNTTWQSQRAKIEVDAIKEALAEQPEQPFNPDWSLLEATQESLREHMATLHKLKAALKLALPDRRIVTAAGDPEDYINSGWNECLDAIRKVLAEQPASKPWVGLTDVEWMNIVNKDHAWFGQRPEDVAHEVAKLVEAKLREKNNE